MLYKQLRCMPVSIVLGLYRGTQKPTTNNKNNMIETLLILIWLHFVADFMLQTDKMATNKSKSSKWLALHVIVYTIPFLWFGWVFALVNGVAHFITDFITARLTTYLWQKEERHWFFVVVGFDQAIHMTTLILSYHYLIGF